MGDQKAKGILDHASGARQARLEHELPPGAQGESVIADEDAEHRYIERVALQGFSDGGIAELTGIVRRAVGVDVHVQEIVPDIDEHKLYDTEMFLVVGAERAFLCWTAGGGTFSIKFFQSLEPAPHPPSPTEEDAQELDYPEEEESPGPNNYQSAKTAADDDIPFRKGAR